MWRGIFFLYSAKIENLVELNRPRWAFRSKKKLQSPWTHPVKSKKRKCVQPRHLQENFYFLFFFIWYFNNNPSYFFYLSNQITLSRHMHWRGNIRHVRRCFWLGKCCHATPADGTILFCGATGSGVTK